MQCLICFFLMKIKQISYKYLSFLKSSFSNASEPFGMSLVPLKSYDHLLYAHEN